MSVLGVEVLVEVVALGVAFGLVYGLLAVGLVLAHRVSGVINFAQADIGVAAATVLAVAVTRWRTPYWLALPGALALGGVLGAVAHVAVVRRLRDVPRLVSVVATLGLGQVLLLTATAIGGTAAAATFPAPPGLPSFELGALHVSAATVGMLVGGPLAVTAVWAWLAHSRNGLELRAAAANPDAARLLGLPAARLSARAWGVAGGLSVLTAVLVGAAPRFIGGSVAGHGLLLRALAAAVVARMHSLPAALAAGVGVGVLEQIAFWNSPSPGLVDVLLLALVVAVLLARRGPDAEPRHATRWVRLDVWRPLPAALAVSPPVRRVLRSVGVGAALVALVAPLVASNSGAVVLTTTIAFAIVALSVGIVSGLAGRLSLGQFAIAGIGAVASVHVVTATGNFPLGLAAAAAAGSLTAVVVALPALRIHGPFLAVTTLAFALAAETWLLPRPWALGAGVATGKPVLGAFPFDTGRRYYLVALAVGGIALWWTRNVHRSGIGRRLVAVRDNPRAAAAFGIDPTRTTFLGFALAGAVAGLGGAVYGHALAVVPPGAFPVAASVAVVAMAVLGGIGTVLGPVLGALYIIGVPAFLPLDAAWLAATALGWLVFVLYVPAGLARPLQVLRDGMARRVARRWSTAPGPGATTGPQPRPAPAVVAVPERDRTSTSPTPAATPAERGTAAVAAVGLHRAYDGVAAVDGTDITVAGEEIVGLIGPNGAGKTTLLDLLSGHVRPDAGTVRVHGTDVSGLAAHQRARLGMARSFQSSVLFPTLRTVDALHVAMELELPTRTVPALLGSTTQERRATERVGAAIAAFGLEAHAETPVHALSTGTRRVCELACLSLLRPSVVLLDEPSAGLARAEVDRLAPLLLHLRHQLRASLLVVEHDLRLLNSVADRIVTMEQGRIVDDQRTSPTGPAPWCGPTGGPMPPQ